MINKIKAEIERLKEDLIKGWDGKKVFHTSVTQGRLEALNDLLSFIESLEKEQDVDLEKEIEDYYHTNLGFILSPVDTRIIVEEIARHFYELGLNAKSDAPKIKGWVARDGEPKFGKLLLFGSKPIRGTKRDNTEHNWVLSKSIPTNFNVWALPDEMFPDLKWEDEPIEVELTISRIVK